jgi:outer membrane protein OmpA-like peptidoglycan-associated protein
MQHQTSRSLTLLAAVLLIVPSFAGCAAMSQSERGAAIGSITGAAVGAVIGRQAGSTATGAVAGAVVGGAAGAIIGRQMDRQAEELQREVEGARVERVGEGIVVTFDSGLLFDFDSDALRAGARDDLRRFADNMRRNPDTDILIVGHTDSTGSVSYNMGLSQRRASSAANFLINQGVDRHRIRTEGRGPHEPVASNETDAGRQANRRVEVVITVTEEYREQLEREHGA